MDFLKPRSHRMKRRRRIYEGKAKVLYEGPEPGTLVQYFKDDATAFNAKKHEVIEGKGVLNNRISEYIFQRLNDIGVPTHFIRRMNMREQLIREVEIIPLEIVVRNVAAGSLATRLGLEEGAQLPRSIIEFYYKNDQLNDPMVSEEHITAFGWAAPQEIDDIMALAIRVNDFLSGLFLGVGIRLIDFKIECGRLWEGENMRIVLADEISPDSCRLWDVQDQRQDGQGPLPQGPRRHDRGLYGSGAAARRRAGERGPAGGHAATGQVRARGWPQRSLNGRRGGFRADFICRRACAESFALLLRRHGLRPRRSRRGVRGRGRRDCLRGGPVGGGQGDLRRRSGRNLPAPPIRGRWSRRRRSVSSKRERASAAARARARWRRGTASGQLR